MRTSPAWALVLCPCLAYGQWTIPPTYDESVKQPYLIVDSNNGNPLGIAWGWKSAALLSLAPRAIVAIQEGCTTPACAQIIAQWQAQTIEMEMCEAEKTEAAACQAQLGPMQAERDRLALLANEWARLCDVVLWYLGEQKRRMQLDTVGSEYRTWAWWAAATYMPTQIGACGQ